MIIKLSSSAHKDLKNIYEFLKLSSKKSAKKEMTHLKNEFKK